MYSVIESQTPFAIVTLEEAKAQCNRTGFNLDDDLFEIFIQVSCEAAQSYTRRMLSTGTVVTVVEEYKPVVQLPYGEATEVTELLLDGVPSTDFTFEPVTQKVTINKSYTTAKITFNAGFATVPLTVKQAVLLMVSTLYKNRDNFVVGLTVAKLPTTSEMLLESVRYYAI